MYVITGATGNTGSVAAQRLLEQGKKVRAIGRSAERLQSLTDKGAEPFVADVSDSAALAKAFQGAEAVYLMLPPNIGNPDQLAYRNRINQAFVAAIQQSGVKHAVVLSSIGADKPEKTGPVVGLYELEQKLNSISDLNALYLRAGYFMENTLGQVSTIQTFGVVAGPLRPDLKLPMIATRDIGAAAADALLKLGFTGHQPRELLGQRDITMTEATSIIGEAIEKPGLQYLHLPDEQIRPALLQMGMSPNMADLLLEMAGSLNSGYMKALEPRSPANTTPTSYEQFVKEEFVPAFRNNSQAA
jgi:uncharacterized protein YbjT (DUF2867 family)